MGRGAGLVLLSGNTALADIKNAAAEGEWVCVAPSGGGGSLQTKHKLIILSSNGRQSPPFVSSFLPARWDAALKKVSGGSRT